MFEDYKEFYRVSSVDFDIVIIGTFDEVISVHNQLKKANEGNRVWLTSYAPTPVDKETADPEFRKNDYVLFMKDQKLTCGVYGNKIDVPDSELYPSFVTVWRTGPLNVKTGQLVFYVDKKDRVYHGHYNGIDKKRVDRVVQISTLYEYDGMVEIPLSRVFLSR